MTAYAARFPILSRLLHWLMAAMILAMLFIGIGMVATVSKRYELLVSIHRPLGGQGLPHRALRLDGRDAVSRLGDAFG